MEISNLKFPASPVILPPATETDGMDERLSGFSDLIIADFADLTLQYLNV
jgi:hypothetical protein